MRRPQQWQQRKSMGWSSQAALASTCRHSPLNLCEACCWLWNPTLLFSLLLPTGNTRNECWKGGTPASYCLTNRWKLWKICQGLESKLTIVALGLQVAFVEGQSKSASMLSTGSLGAIGDGHSMLPRLRTSESSPPITGMHYRQLRAGQGGT